MIKALKTCSLIGSCFSRMNSKILVAPSMSPCWQYREINRWNVTLIGNIKLLNVPISNKSIAWVFTDLVRFLCSEDQPETQLARIDVHSPDRHEAMRCSAKYPWPHLVCSEFSRFPAQEPSEFREALQAPNYLKRMRWFAGEISYLRLCQSQCLPQQRMTSNDWELVADWWSRISSRTSSRSRREMRPVRRTSWSKRFSDLSKPWSELSGTAAEANPLWAIHKLSLSH